MSSVSREEVLGVAYLFHMASPPTQALPTFSSIRKLLEKVNITTSHLLQLLFVSVHWITSIKQRRKWHLHFHKFTAKETMTSPFSITIYCLSRITFCHSEDCHEMLTTQFQNVFSIQRQKPRQTEFNEQQKRESMLTHGNWSKSIELRSDKDSVSTRL